MNRGETIAVAVLGATAVGLGALAYVEFQQTHSAIASEALVGSVVAAGATVGVAVGGHRHPVVGGIIGGAIPMALGYLGLILRAGLNTTSMAKVGA